MRERAIGGQEHGKLGRRRRQTGNRYGCGAGIGAEIGEGGGAAGRKARVGSAYADAPIANGRKRASHQAM